LAGFDVVPTVPVVIDDDVERAAMPVRPYAALYVGGMGSRQQNFYNALAVRMGYEREAREVQDLFLNRQHRDAAMAVPLSFIDQTSLIGPRDRIRDRLGAYADAGVTTLNVAVYHGDLDSRLATLRTMAELLDESGLGEVA
jgi:alkanesulfonate monooxygenase SsuD/methylene tetrahydromethanopterin reductase-like flavin-dependent oxidoreductase (luciferase family)